MAGPPEAHDTLTSRLAAHRALIVPQLLGAAVVVVEMALLETARALSSRCEDGLAGTGSLDAYAGASAHRNVSFNDRGPLELPYGDTAESGG